MEIKCRRAVKEDVRLYYDWANDPIVRESSFHSDPISFENHSNWFYKKIEDPNTLMFVFEYDKQPAGQVRIEVKESSAVIGISIDANFRGKKLGDKMLKLAAQEYFKTFDFQIEAYIKYVNKASVSIFEKSGFKYVGDDTVNNCECYKYILEK